MATHDQIEEIGNRAKLKICDAWDLFIDGMINDVALVREFYSETGVLETLDGIEWYVREWRGY